MIDQNLLESLSSSDKESFARGLKELITQTYEVEKEFVELKALFEEVLDILPTAVWVLEQEGEIFYQNSLASEIPEILEKLDLQNTNRQEIEVESKVYLVQTNQKLNKYIISATDITHEKRRERLASMGQISAHLAHEIRNPVGSVALLASTLLKRVDIKNKTLVLEIKKSIWRVERIVKATLLFSKGVQIHKSEIIPQNIQMKFKNPLIITLTLRISILFLDLMMRCLRRILIYCVLFYKIFYLMLLMPLKRVMRKKGLWKLNTIRIQKR